MPSNDVSLDLGSNDRNFVKDGVFYIYGYFDDSIAKNIIPDFVKQIEEQSKLRTGNIKIYIDSFGGYTNYVWNLVTLIQRAKDNGIIVETHVYGFAASCGSILACAGTKGFRVIGENSTHLCHLGGGVIVAETDKQLERGTGHLKTHFNKVRKHYKKYADINDLDKVLSDDQYFIEGRAILKNGLADYLIKEGGHRDE